jgi:hypothetical protein
MNIYSRVLKTIEGVDREFVMIDIDEYNNYMLLTHINFKKIETKKEQQQKEEEEKEKQKINSENSYLRSLEEKEKEYNKKIEFEIMKNRNHNDKIKKIKEELKEEYKEVFKTNENAKIKKCDFCSHYRVYPTHFLNEDNKVYIRSYTKNKQQLKAACCVDCFMAEEERKANRKTECSIFCNVCQSSYIAFGDDGIYNHNKSIKHKTILKIQKENKQRELKPSVKLELLKIKDLHLICSKTLNEHQTYLINGYTRIKKEDLIKKMYDVYDKLIFQ